jgi:hypothetical protein
MEKSRIDFESLYAVQKNAKNVMSFPPWASVLGLPMADGEDRQAAHRPDS